MDPQARCNCPGNRFNYHNRHKDPPVSDPEKCGGLLGQPRFGQTLAASAQVGSARGRSGWLADGGCKGKMDNSHGYNHHTDPIKGGAHFILNILKQRCRVVFINVTNYQS
uniref:Uncharacterized protein n=2 Tax=Oryza sativa subsp. japonica TaxID=39947 RepID=Q33AJ3_ORYSJ|nr:Hypothetical protein [Oryza sativa Japonica Group]ABB46932.1 hypothetical protein LOC_Os10g09630 [Oryza sativa Japonica Group]